MRRSHITLAVGLLAAAGIAYFAAWPRRPAPASVEHVAATTDQEVALGLHAAPILASRFGGLARDAVDQQTVDRIGDTLLAPNLPAARAYPFDFHVLEDRQVVNSFSLPGGQIFITTAMLRRLQEDAHIAAALAHEMGHVVSRHAAEQLINSEVADGLSGAAMLARYDPENRASRSARGVAGAISLLIQITYNVPQEREADDVAARLLLAAGYDPRALLHVADMVAGTRAGHTRGPDYTGTHPAYEDQAARMDAASQAASP